jgi:hypothetical protein
MIHSYRAFGLEALAVVSFLRIFTIRTVVSDVYQSHTRVRTIIGTRNRLRITLCTKCPRRSDGNTKPPGAGWPAASSHSRTLLHMELRPYSRLCPR